MTTILKCPQCGDTEIVAQQKAIVAQDIELLENGVLEYEAWESDDVEFVDKEWYVCRGCLEHNENLDHFKAQEGAGSYIATVEFRVEAANEEEAVDLVQYELAARQEGESILKDYIVRRVD